MLEEFCDGGGALKPIIKWPGGKSREIDKIIHLIPQYERYVEPFFGGGALFFHLAPKNAAVNDISSTLMSFYRLVQAQDPELRGLLYAFAESFQALVEHLTQDAPALTEIFHRLRAETLTQEALDSAMDLLLCRLGKAGFDTRLVREPEVFYRYLRDMAADKYRRTLKNYEKQPYSPEDLQENLITGFAGGYYMYFRKVFNNLEQGEIPDASDAYRAAVFYFIREYCYGSMFRYNAKGEFNIPYGGMSYNRKDLKNKVSHIFSRETGKLFRNTGLYCMDFYPFLDAIGVNGQDFLFLDPPYDTDFSDYEGNVFGKSDQARLAEYLKSTPAQFILIIKNTEYIRSLYDGHFRILSFDKQYTYNVRSRNDRAVEHLIITNISDS